MPRGTEWPWSEAEQLAPVSPEAWLLSEAKGERGLAVEQTGHWWSRGRAKAYRKARGSRQEDLPQPVSPRDRQIGVDRLTGRCAGRAKKRFYVNDHHEQFEMGHITDPAGILVARAASLAGWICASSPGFGLLGNRCLHVRRNRNSGGAGSWSLRLLRIRRAALSIQRWLFASEWGSVP